MNSTTFEMTRVKAVGIQYILETLKQKETKHETVKTYG